MDESRKAEIIAYLTDEGAQYDSLEGQTEDDLFGLLTNTATEALARTFIDGEQEHPEDIPVNIISEVASLVLSSLSSVSLYLTNGDGADADELFKAMTAACAKTIDSQTEEFTPSKFVPEQDDDADMTEEDDNDSDDADGGF